LGRGFGRGFGGGWVAGAGLVTSVLTGSGVSVRMAKVTLGVFVAMLDKLKGIDCNSAKCSKSTARHSISQVVSGVLERAMSTKMGLFLAALWDELNETCDFE
jgi:hypothetical protein